VVLALGLDAPPLYLVEDSPANPLHVPPEGSRGVPPKRLQF
jgi:hypothetical protein